MPQYQSFPDARGDSRTLEKLKALRLPVLKGRSFLDVGCNEGFFCGFAHFAGASRSVGLDRSREFIARARARFPDCEFHCQGWDALPDGPFDVILLASALHYAEDQPALLYRLVEHLAPDGVLVLEMGIVNSRKAEWVKVTRGIDQRWFPSLAKLREILAPYASKWMGPSVPQAGDPVERHVVHVSRRRPVACLLMQPSAFGKSNLASQLFEPTGITVVSNDRQIRLIAEGALQVPDALHAAAAEEFSSYFIDRAVQRIFERGLGPILVQTWLDDAKDVDFVMDGYIPEKYHSQIKQQLVDAGYLPVVLDWDRPGQALYGDAELQAQADAFFRAMSAHGAPAMEDSAVGPNASGFVDRIRVKSGGHVEIGGWARTGSGCVPEALAVRLKGRIVTIDSFETVARPDVQQHVGASHDKLGFRVALDVAGVREPADLGEEFSVAPLGGRPLPFTKAVAKALGRDRKGK